MPTVSYSFVPDPGAPGTVGTHTGTSEYGVALNVASAADEDTLGTFNDMVAEVA